MQIWVPEQQFFSIIYKCLSAQNDTAEFITARNEMGTSPFHLQSIQIMN